MPVGRNPLASSALRPDQEGGRDPLSVSDAVSAAKSAVGAMPTLLVAGEVSGFRGPNSRSGHCYFQVKDESSAMDVIVWRNTYAKLGVALRDGLSVVMAGKFDVYVGTGRLSFIARSVELAGEGLLRQQVAALARKLEAEGLMAQERKRPIPRFCTRIAVVTSLSGSVIEDVKRTLRRRNPLVAIDVVGCAVQGPGAPETIMRALDVAAQAAPEAILLVRGGGSYEDLMTFNDEMLARAVADCPVPVVTGIGHEPDTSICDMVSDRRCSTPTAAAESVAPAIDEVVQAIEGRRRRMGAALGSLVLERRGAVDSLDGRSRQSVSSMLSRERVLIDALSRHRCLEDPRTLVEDRILQLMQSEQRLHDAIPRSLEAKRHDMRDVANRMRSVGEGLLRPHEAMVGKAAATLEALSPLKVLSRGYAIVHDDEGHVVTDATSLSVQQDIRVMMNKGSVMARVTEVQGEGKQDD